MILVLYANHSKQFRSHKVEIREGPFQTSCYCRAEPNWSIKFDFSTAIARRLKQSRARLGFKRHATAVPNSIHKLQMH